MTAVDHTGDAGIEVEASTLPKLFRAAASGMFELMTADGGGSDDSVRRLELQATEGPSLLRAWLQELLYLHATEGFCFSGAEFLELSPLALKATLRGRMVSGPALREIKGVTYHGLVLDRRSDGWKARVIFDL